MDLTLIGIGLFVLGGIYLMLPDGKSAKAKKSSKTSKSNSAKINSAKINSAKSNSAGAGEKIESGDVVREQLPALEEKALEVLIEKGLNPADKTIALVSLRNIGKVNYDPRVYKKTLLKLIDESPTVKG